MTCATAQELVPIKKFIAENSNRDPNNSEHVGYRCYVVLSLIGGMFEQDDRPDVKTQGTLFRAWADGFIPAAMGKNFNPDYARKQGEIISQAYGERIARSRAMSGNIFDDPVVRSDFEICTAIAKAR
jgi:hypothetical protein